MDKDKNNGTGWKWLAGGLGLLLTYQLGYDNGLDATRQAAVASYREVTPTVPADISAIDTAALVEPETPLVEPTTDTFTSDRHALEAASETGSAGSLGPGSSATPSSYTSGSSAKRVELASSSLESDYADDAETAIAEAYGSGESEIAATASVSSAAPQISIPSLPSSSSSYVPAPVRVGCAENGSCYGDISAATGVPKTVAVRGYFRRDGTYVRGHYRSKR